MTKMNWNRAQSEGPDGDWDVNGAQATIRIKYQSTCATCGGPLNVGDRGASTHGDNGNRVYHHASCIYGTTPDESPISDADVTRATRPEKIEGRCQATKKDGKPCQGGAKRGESYCGPHLDQMAVLTERRASSAAPRDNVDDPF